jgi:hypothetical protein
VTSVFTGRVHGGVVVADDVALPEGTTVTIVVEEPEDEYAAHPPVVVAVIEASIADADRGLGVPWETVRAQLRNDSK